MNSEDNNKDDWDLLYQQGNENYLFYPDEGIIRFFSRHIRKKTGHDRFVDHIPNLGQAKILDVGCGLGRHLKYLLDLGFDPYGMDLSGHAIAMARHWLTQAGLKRCEERILECDARSLPFADHFFDHAISHAALDDMRFSIAQQAVVEIHRVLKPGGYLYCDLYSDVDSGLELGFTGEMEVDKGGGNSIVRFYFNQNSINLLFSRYFLIKEMTLARFEEVLAQRYWSRWHVVLQSKSISSPGES
ncbi:MAG: class I SAM-dependent methyltransferase [Magnetococcus sp. YQC-5]